MTALWIVVGWLILVCAVLLAKIKRLEGRCHNFAVDIAQQGALAKQETEIRRLGKAVLDLFEYRAKDVSTVARLAEHCEDQAKIVADIAPIIDGMRKAGSVKHDPNKGEIVPLSTGTE